MTGVDPDRASALHRRLQEACAHAAPKRTVVALSVNGSRIYAAIGARSADREVFRSGCATKLLVAALSGRKLGAHGLGHDVPARRVLGGASAEVLGDTTFRQLLEHTHGLDDTGLPGTPRRRDGRIDVRRLLARLEGKRIAAPGEVYSYSNAGAMLVAAALETLERRAFERQLRDDLLAPLGIEARRDRGSGRGAGGPAGVCPATGGELAFTVGGLLAFLEATAGVLPAGAAALDPLRDAGRARPLAAAPDRHTPLPGWHPLERGVRLGWKCYAGGWLGHQSAWPGASLLLCVRPRDRSTLVVASEDEHAAVVGARVLGRQMPELFAPVLPRRLPAAAAARLDPRRYCGRYASSAECLEVGADAAGLVLDAGGVQARLIPACGEIFFLEPAAVGRAFVQFIDVRGGRFRRLWDGRFVLPLVCSPVGLQRGT